MSVRFFELGILYIFHPKINFQDLTKTISKF